MANREPLLSHSSFGQKEADVPVVIDRASLEKATDNHTRARRGRRNKQTISRNERPSHLHTAKKRSDDPNHDEPLSLSFCHYLVFGVLLEGYQVAVVRRQSRDSAGRQVSLFTMQTPSLEDVAVEA